MKTSIIYILLLINFNLHAQLGNLFFGGDKNDFIYEMTPSPDGNFYVVGSKTISISQVWLMKISPQGELIWEKIFTPFNDAVGEFGYSVNVLPDGSLIITGDFGIPGPFDRKYGLAIKTTSNGELIWKKRYEEVASLYDATNSTDGILFGGWHDNTGSTDSGILLFCDEDGEIISQKEVEVHNQTYIKKVSTSSDGNFIIAGRSNVIGAGFGGIFLQKIDNSGEIVWAVTNDTDFKETLSSSFNTDLPLPLGVVVQLNGTIMVVNPSSYNPDIKVLTFNNNGELIRESLYGDPRYLEFPLAVIALDNGSNLIAGSISGGATFAMSIDEFGKEEWRKNYYRANQDFQVFDVEETDNRFLLGGRLQEDILDTSDYDGVIFAVEKDGNPYPYNIKGKIILDENGNCKQDVNERTLSTWFMDVKSQFRSDTLMTDKNGLVEYDVEAGRYVFTAFNPDTSRWKFCLDSIAVKINSMNPQDSIVFFVQSIEDCAELYVSITQPDFVRCSTSCLNINISNNGSLLSEPHNLRVSTDPDLTLSSASVDFEWDGNDAIFQVASVAGFNVLQYEVCYSLDCDVQLGAVHQIAARLEPVSCGEIYSGPRFIVNAICNNEFIDVQFHNTGGGGNSVYTTYDVIADGIYVFKDVPVHLPESGAAVSLQLPADGRTWIVELDQAPEVPDLDKPVVVIEGCGNASQGLHTIGFGNSWQLNDREADVAIINAPNTNGIPFKVSEKISGMGYYNFITYKTDLEYSARMENITGHIVSQAVFELTFGAELDPRTFKLFSPLGQGKIDYFNHNKIRIILDDLSALPGEYIMISFSITPRENIMPDTESSLFVVTAKGYLDNEGPYVFSTAFNNYTATVPVEQDPYTVYPDAYRMLDGKNYEFGSSMVKGMQNELFIGGESNSYGAREFYDAFVVKANADGIVDWLTSFDAGTGGHNGVAGIAPLPDGTSLILGNYREPFVENTLPNSKFYLARLSRNGSLIWIKYPQPQASGNGAWTNGMLSLPDNNFLIYGYAQNDGSDQFYMKIDASGEEIWSSHETIIGSNFRPNHGIVLPDGSSVFVGTNESTVINADVYIQKINSDGTVDWSTEYDSEHGIYLGEIANDQDGNFMVAGYSIWAETPTEYVISPTFIKIDGSGEIMWEKNPIVGEFKITEPSSIVSTNDGNFLVGGNMRVDTVGPGIDVMMIKIDNEANVLWVKNFGNTAYESTSKVMAFSDTEYFLLGHNQPYPPFFNLQTFFIKTNNEGVVSSNQIEKSDSHKPSIILFPNPASSMVHLALLPEPTHHMEYLIFDLAGRVVEQGIYSNSNTPVMIDQLSPGLYYIGFPNSIYPAKQFVVSR